jgi:hypothetical protein
MSGGREPAHVEANLRQDDPRRQHVDTGDRDEQRNQALKGGLTGHHLLIHPGYHGGDLLIDLLDRGIRGVDLVQVEAQHEAMMIRHAAAKRLA